MAAASHRELKKGSAELLVLALLGDQPSHGYEIGKLIAERPERRASFPRGFSFAIALPPRPRSDGLSGAVNRIVEVRHA